MKLMTIGKSYIIDLGSVVRLCADINLGEETKPYYFEVDKKYEHYLCIDRADPFLLALIYYAQTKGYNIKCIQPVSERLLYQLQTYYLPITSKCHKSYEQDIKISAEYESTPLENAGKVVASLSRGVDSFYTIVKHLNSSDKYKITNLFLTDYFNTFTSETEYRQRYEKLKASARIISDELGIELTAVYTNLYDFNHPYWVDMFAFKYFSCIYALGKLFKTFLYSSGYEIKDFDLSATNKDSSHYDLFSVDMANTDRISFYSSGGEVTRIQKMQYIAKNKVVQKRLYVCNFKEYNCGSCDKCMRTQFELFATNNLQKFSGTFDIKIFDQYKYKYWAKMLRRRSEFDMEIINTMKKNGIHAPLSVKVRAVISSPINLVRILVRKSKFLERLYYNTFIYRLYNGDSVAKLLKGNK